MKDTSFCTLVNLMLNWSIFPYRSSSTFVELNFLLAQINWFSLRMKISVRNIITFLYPRSCMWRPSSKTWCLDNRVAPYLKHSESGRRPRLWHASVRGGISQCYLSWLFWYGSRCLRMSETYKHLRCLFITVVIR